MHQDCIDQMYWNDLDAFPQLAISKSPPWKFSYKADYKPKELPLLKKAIVAGWGKVIFPTYHPPDEAAPYTFININPYTQQIKAFQIILLIQVPNELL